MLDNSYLIKQIECVQDDFILSLAANTLLTNEECRKYLDSNLVKLDNLKFDFPGLKGWITQHEKDIFHPITGYVRILIGDSFELIREYCGNSSQSAEFKSQDWYWFAYMVRCTFFHGGKIDYRLLEPYVEWDGLQIKKEMDGTQLSLEFFSPSKAWVLFEMMKKFVHEKL